MKIATYLSLVFEHLLHVFVLFNRQLSTRVIVGQASLLLLSLLREHAVTLVTQPALIMTFSTYVVLEGGESNARLLGHQIVALAELTEVQLLFGIHTEELFVSLLGLIVAVDGIKLGATPVVTLLG